MKDSEILQCSLVLSAGGGKAFFDVMWCHCKGGRTSGVTRDIHVADLSACWVCILHYGLNYTMRCLCSPCTSEAGKGCSMASWALTGAKKDGCGCWAANSGGVVSTDAKASLQRRCL